MTAFPEFFLTGEAPRPLGRRSSGSIMTGFVKRHSLIASALDKPRLSVGITPSSSSSAQGARIIPVPGSWGLTSISSQEKEGYATTLCDLANHKVYDVVLGRTELSLRKPFENLLDKHRVQVVVMDLSETYRSLVRKHFPRAKIVADRFHVIRLVNHHFMKVWQMIDPEGRKNRGLLSLMRRHEKKLAFQQKARLRDYFSQFPALSPLWEFKEKLCRLLLVKHRTQRQCQRLVKLYLYRIQALQDSPFEPLKTLGKTLQSWSEEIVRMWRFTKSNGITEGFHTKMELITRRAYGFRNFQNYRLRVRALCA